METVRSVVASLCVSFVFFGVVMMLTPNGGTQKNVKTLLSIAIVSVIVAVISGVSANINDVDLNLSFGNSSSDAAQLNSAVADLNVTATEKAVEDIVAETLEQRGIKFYEITVKADILDETSISITETVIVCPKGQVYDCQTVLNDLGLKGTVTERK